MTAGVRDACPSGNPPPFSAAGPGEYRRAPRRRGIRPRISRGVARTRGVAGKGVARGVRRRAGEPRPACPGALDAEVDGRHVAVAPPGVEATDPGGMAGARGRDAPRKAPRSGRWCRACPRVLREESSFSVGRSCYRLPQTAPASRDRPVPPPDSLVRSRRERRSRAVRGGGVPDQAIRRPVGTCWTAVRRIPCPATTGTRRPERRPGR